MPLLRVVTWNLAEGTQSCSSDSQDNSCQAGVLNAIAGCLASVQPDVVLLNEIVKWNDRTWHGVNQVSWIGEAIGMPYYIFARSATLYGKGEKGVVVMSRFPLKFEARIEHSSHFDGGGYATLHASFDIDGIRHHVFSSRFTAYDGNENINSHHQLAAAIAALPLNEPVIAGGDFNSGFERWDSQGNPTLNHMPLGYSWFIGNAGMQHVLGGNGWETPSPDDHLFFRGPYNVLRSERVSPRQPNPSDHPWVFAELLPTSWNQPARAYSGVAATVPATDELLVVQTRPLQSRNWKPEDGWGTSWQRQEMPVPQAGGPISAVSEGGQTHLLFIASDGAVNFMKRRANGTWWMPFWWYVTNPEPPLLGVPGGAVTGVSSQPGSIHILYATASGATMAVRGDTNTGTWLEPDWVRRGLTAPGGHITGVSRRSGQIDIFTVGTDRRVYTAAWNAQQGWAGWWPIPGSSAPPGAPIAAVSRRPDFLDIFVSDDRGRMMSAAWDPSGQWKGWWHIQKGFTVPGGYISAVSRAQDHLDIFTAGLDGKPYTAAWNPSHGWGGWWSLNASVQRAGGPIAAVSRSANIIDIFFIDTVGVVQTMGWAPGGNWGGPWALPG